MNLNYKQRPEFPEKDEPPQADSTPTLTVFVGTPPPPAAPEPGGGTTCGLVQPITCNVQPSLVAPERSGGGTFNSPLPTTGSQNSDTPLLQHPVSSPDWALLLQHT